MPSLALLLAVIRVGIIGLDTSHAPAFVLHLNVKQDKPSYSEFRVTHAVVLGSRTIKSSVERQPKYTAEVKEMGVEIVPDIDTLLTKVDAVMLETNDGQEHLWQAEKCFKAGKRVFIDKPLAHNLRDSAAIVDLAEKHGATFFTASALRFTKAIRDIRAKGTYVRGMDTWTPYNIEPTHDAWYWYGIHGADPLFAVLGRGCTEVVSFTGADGSAAIGRWADGRFGIVRGLVTTKKGAEYGGMIFTEKSGPVDMGGYEGYGFVLDAVLDYFKTGVVPVDPRESLEVMAFMTAAERSAKLGGVPVKIADILAEARRPAR